MTPPAPGHDHPAKVARILADARQTMAASRETMQRCDDVLASMDDPPIPPADHAALAGQKPEADPSEPAPETK